MPKLKPFVSGDKAIVNFKPVKVTIKTANPPYYNYGEYYCDKCDRSIGRLELYGKASNGNRYCLKCCDRRVRRVK